MEIQKIHTEPAGASALLCAVARVSVLFVRADSIYKTLGVDCYDFERDALTWSGGGPIVAHPPCRAWGKYKGFARPRPGERWLAVWSILQIRRHGGVLEHPRHSGLWKTMKLPTGNERDVYGGFSISVNQSWWGHKAKKETLLYICGCAPSDLPPIPISFDAITHYVGFPKGYKGRMKEITKGEREATPVEFAKWLIQVAAGCRSRHCT